MDHAIVGCDFAARHPEVAARIRAYLEGRGDLGLIACCRKDLPPLRAGDTVTIGCTLCDLMLAERAPQAERRSIYRLLLEDEGFSWPDHAGLDACLQDCWRERHNARLHEDVRACLRRMGVSWRELEESRERTRFCGTWLNNPAPPDCVELAPLTFERLERSRRLLPAAEQRARMALWCSQYATDAVVVYCNGCERGVAAGGKRPIQLLELLFPSPGHAS